MLVVDALPFPPVPTLEQILEERFQLSEFRPWQREAIDAVLGEPGKVLVVAPTGGGKSLTYQFPATVLPNVTLVICPLVALMEDQVRSLEARGIPAAYLASTLSIEERRQRVREAREGKYKLLYCAPERLASDGFVELLASCKPSMVAIDEAHCISQWGHDFRPDYLRIGAILERLRPPRVLACTATATPRVRQEIMERLGLEGGKEVLRGFARPNLHLEARSVDGPREAKGLVLDALEKNLGSARTPRGTGIVYCATRKASEQMAADLSRQGYRAAAYHAGLDAEVRADVNAKFAYGKIPIVAATNAFGMGIDRSDVRIVVHAQPPASLEAYYQEVGRGGRDGEEAHGLLLCSPSDVQLRRRLCESGEGGPAAAARHWGLFRELLRYLDARTCRHDFILRYFGDEREVLGGCGHCDVCAALDEEGDLEELQEEAATEVRKALAGVARAKRRAGLAAVGDMLRGERTERVERFAFDQLTTFGVLKHRSQHWIGALLRALLAAGFVDLSGDEPPVPYVTESGWQVMTSTGPLRFRLPAEQAEPTGKRVRRERVRKEPKAEVALSEPESELFAKLRDARAELAKARKVPAYVIAPDATLHGIARARPTTDSALLAVVGMGPYRVETFGQALLDVVRKASPH